MIDYLPQINRSRGHISRNSWLIFRSTKGTREAICKGLMNDEMRCVIASEDPGNVFSWTFAWCYKNRVLYEKLHSYLSENDTMENQESQESSANTEVPFDVTEITTDDINMGPVGNTQSRDIYEVQPRRNKSLKLLALHILKHLPEDILREELDISSFKSNEAIPDYGPCMECDIPILTEDPPRSLVLNVCDDMIHRTCAKTMYKDGTLLCSCGKADNSDPLLPFQYSIVDYGGREKSSISESDRPSLVNLKNLGYNILKSLDDETVGDIDFPGLDSCSECDNDILMSPLKAFTYLTCF